MFNMGIVSYHYPARRKAAWTDTEDAITQQKLFDGNAFIGRRILLPES